MYITYMNINKVGISFKFNSHTTCSYKLVYERKTKHSNNSIREKNHSE